MIGWSCPHCGKAHAPHVSTCPNPRVVGPITVRFDQTAPVPFTPSYNNPMPICGCTGPCANAACPHRGVVTC